MVDQIYQLSFGQVWLLLLAEMHMCEHEIQAPSLD
jgi:hypothetical protein